MVECLLSSGFVGGGASGAVEEAEEGGEAMMMLLWLCGVEGRAGLRNEDKISTPKREEDVWLTRRREANHEVEAAIGLSDHKLEKP